MRFCAEERMLSKAREELENGVAMVVAIGQQLNDTFNVENLNTITSFIEKANDMSNAEVLDYIRSK